MKNRSNEVFSEENLSCEVEGETEGEDHESTGHRLLKPILWLTHQWESSSKRLWNT